jgi:hypothetical protein
MIQELIDMGWRTEGYQTWLDKQAEKLIGDGDVSHLPNAGKPMDLEDNSWTPAEDRIANKFMKDHEVVPAWMQLGQELQDEHDALLKRLEHYARDYGKRIVEARQRASALMEREADDRWYHACKKIRADIDKYNSRLLTYNVTVPRPFTQRVPLNAEEEIRKVERFTRPSSGISIGM